MEKKLIAWSAKGYSHLPWRVERSLYRTLVSEIMLQQTTVQTVLNHFDQFINKFSSIQKLAKSSEEEICMAWKGLGYYRRARNLRKAAIDICEKYHGKIPTDYDSLIMISGIGAYTANALISIGHNQRAIALDANLERVLSRYFWVDIEKGPKLQKELYRLFEEGKLFANRKKINFRNLNEALMDLGRIYCQANKTDCLLCPISKDCRSFKKKSPLVLPRISENNKKPVKHELELLRVVVKSKNKVITIKRKKGEWLEGQYECPTFILKTSDKKLKQYPFLSGQKISIKGLKSIKSTITKYKIKNYIIELSKSEFEKMFNKAKFNNSSLDIEKTNFSSTTLKIFKKIGLTA